MQYQRWLAPVLLFLLTPCAHPQVRGGSGAAAGGMITSGNVHVHIIFADTRRAGTNLLVRLMQGSSTTPVAMTYTNDAGEADFRNVVVGPYHVEVSGEGIETTESELFDVDERQMSQAEYVTVHQVGVAGERVSGARSPTISAAELNVPGKAKDELAKAVEAMTMQDWKKALERLNKAIAIYPKYAAAYNNLGVVYSHMNDEVHEREALEKAISLDDHFVPAYLNLGKLCLRHKDLVQAENLLARAVSADPGNPESLMLLADAQYMNHNYDGAIASARQAHNGPQAHSSVVHYIAGRAYQQENRQQDALAEFQVFLKEEPSGPRADHVREDIARMQGRPAQ